MLQLVPESWVAEKVWEKKNQDQENQAETREGAAQQELGRQTDTGSSQNIHDEEKRAAFKYIQVHVHVYMHMYIKHMCV